MKKFITKAFLLLKSEKADAKFDSSVQIVISFIIGAIVLGILISVFDTSIRNWITNTIASWFGNGIPRPSY